MKYKVIKLLDLAQKFRPLISIALLKKNDFDSFILKKLILIALLKKKPWFRLFDLKESEIIF